MFDHGAIWAIATILGPLLMLAGFVYGVNTYRRRNGHTEQATRDLYREGAENEKRREGPL
jgi:hypothetical protein